MSTIKNNLEKLEMVHRRTVRLIKGLKDIPFSDRLTEFKLCSLTKRRLKLVTVYKYLPENHI